MLKRPATLARKPTSKLQLFLQLAALPFILNMLVKFAFRKVYPVHQSGIVVVTGASTGIGRHAAEYLATKGFEVYAGVRKQEDADSISSLNIPNLHPLFLDVTSHASCEEAVQRISAESARLKLPFVGLVNNAGISRFVPLEFHKLEDIKSLFETNVFGLIDLTQLSLPLLRESQGRIVMISSIAGIVGTPQYSAYSASKFALEGMSDALRREIAHFGVSVSIVQPAYVKSAIREKVLPDDDALYTVHALMDGTKELMEELYAKFFTDKKRQKALNILNKRSEPTVTSEAIFDALTAAAPRTRYPVANSNGIPAKVINWLFWFLPDRVADWFVEHLN